MNKLIYSLSALLLIMVLAVGCKKGGNDGDDPADPQVVKPNITLQTGIGYTFTTETKQEGTSFKIGIRVSHTENLRAAKVTQNFNGTGEVLLWDSTMTGTVKAMNRDLIINLPSNNKGAYVYTITATDKDNVVGELKLTINVSGPLYDRGSDSVFHLKSTTRFSAYDLVTAENITAAVGAGNDVLRDIIDNSPTAGALAKSWKSGNTTRFKKYVGSKAYPQFSTEADILAAWNSASDTEAETAQINNMEENDLYIAKVTRVGTPIYMLIAIDSFSDAAGSENDYTVFQYKH
jgi:hypothetical protein